MGLRVAYPTDFWLAGWVTWTKRTKYYEQPASLYPYDIRHDPADRAFADRAEDGRVRIRAHTQPELVEGVVVVDGRGFELAVTGRSRRFTFWEALIEAGDDGHLAYSFAFHTPSGQPVYMGRSGVANALEGWEPFFRLNLAELAPIDVPAWARGAVIYQIFPDRFANGDPSLTPPGSTEWGSPPHHGEFQGGDLPGIIDRLDYLSELGVDAIYLNPIFSSPSNHKYDTSDYYSVDPAFGGDDNLRRLVEAAHGRDIRLLLDVAFDHCYPNFEPFQDLLRTGRDSDFADWFTVYDWPPRVGVREELARGYYSSDYYEFLKGKLIEAALPTEELTGEGPPLEPTYRAWSGVPTMPQLNLENPATRDYFLDVATYWIREFDIDGWRMDVAREPTHSFWRDVRTVVRSAKADAYLLAEIWGDTSEWLQGDQFDATMSYTFRDICVGYIAERTLTSDEAMDGIHAMLAMYAQPVTDVSHNVLGSHDVERFLHVADGNMAALQLATFLQLTMPGAPGLYYGDEVGLGGGKDPANRAAFPWDDMDHTLAGEIRLITALRRDHPALRFGRFHESARLEQAIAFTRVHEGQEILVVVNNGDTSLEYDLPRSSTVLYGETPLPSMSGLIAEL